MGNLLKFVKAAYNFYRNTILIFLEVLLMLIDHSFLYLTKVSYSFSPLPRIKVNCSYISLSIVVKLILLDE